MKFSSPVSEPDYWCWKMKDMIIKSLSRFLPISDFSTIKNIDMLRPDEILLDQL